MTFRVLYSLPSNPKELLSLMFTGVNFADVIIQFQASTNLTEDSIYSVRKVNV